jgi:hypothetical protein
MAEALPAGAFEYERRPFRAREARLARVPSVIPIHVEGTRVKPSTCPGEAETTDGSLVGH